ncbi:MAG: IPT/TIG domain-containing protein [Acidobacteriia bacterium]|nr:IPT/TIG domain-containing protein [Terriglobia bacterium]
MKRNHILVGLALGAAVALAGCNSNSPTAPKQPTPTAYNISLTLSTPVAGINEAITAMALVTTGSGNAPDGTSVIFTGVGNAYFPTNGGALSQQVFVTTTGGRAGVLVYSSPSGGAGKVTASVPNKSDSKNVSFTGGSAAPGIFSVLPNRATPLGGTQVVIRGQGFYSPQTVKFVVGSGTYTANIVSYSTDGTSITVLTPQLPNPTGSDVLADIVVTLSSGTVTFSGGFTFSATTGIPVLYSVSPLTGSASGGEILTLVGRYFTEPIEVDFAFTDPFGGGAKSLPAHTVDVQHGADGTDTAHVQVPRASTSSISQTIPVNLTIKNMVGGNSQSATYPNAFVYAPDVTVPPVIYYVAPGYGSVKGNETVTIFGANFVQPLTVVIGAITETVQSVSSDGTSITILTQPFSGTAPAEAQTVTVTTSLGVGTLAAAFKYLEGQTPQLYTLMPNIGPLEGGTRVTITGVGFQYPVQVLFTLAPAPSTPYQAQVVSTNFDQVVCVSPSITASGLPSPITASVTVTNMTGQTGKASNSLPFQYGQAMFISGISPISGPADTATTVTITGQGFVAPVTVMWGTTQQWPVLSVAGTQIVTKSAPVPGACAPGSGLLTVTNLDTGQQATSADSFTYQSASPLITSVKIGSGNTVQQYQPVGIVTCTAPWSSHTVTINGSGFSTAGVQVKFGDVGPVLVTPTNATTITLTLPDLTELATSFPSIDCTMGGGATGKQKLPKPVPVTVTNTTSGCSNTLDGAIIILPCDTACRLVSAPTVTSLDVTSGPEAGGTAVRVFGTGFVSGANVRFGGALASSVTWPSTTEIDCTTPPGTVGPVNVVVTNPDTQTGTLPNGFTYNPTLTVVLAGNILTNTVSSAPALISLCATTCSAVFPYNGPVTLTATASGTWSGDCSGVGTSPTSGPTMNADRSCTVTFP